MANAEVGDEQIREDPTVNELERRAAEILGHEDSVFVPTATMANEIALRVLGEPGDELIAEELSHILIAELGGPAVHAGLMTRPLPSVAGRFTHGPGTRGCAEGRPRPCADDTHRGDREHAQRLRRPRLAARRGRGHGRDVPRARPQPPPRRRAALQRRGRERRRAVGDRQPRGHGHDLLLEGARLPARRDRRGLGGAHGAGAAVQAPVRRRDAAGRDRRGRLRVRARPQRRPARRGPRACPPARARRCTRRASRSISSASRRTSSSSTSDRWASTPGDATERLLAKACASPGTLHPGVLRAVTHLGIGDEDIDRAIERDPARARRRS